MKKLLLIACLMVGSLTTFAQVYQDNSDITFGIKGGVNFATLQQTYSGSSSAASSGTLTSFHAGIFSDFKFGDSFSVQPTLLYTGKGASDKEYLSEDGATASINAKLMLNYLELPIYAVYHIQVNDNDFYFGAGPYLAYGLNGKLKGTENGSFDGQSNSSTVDEKVDFGSSDSTGVKRMDYGVSALVGFKFSNGFSVNAYYDLGLANLATNGNDSSDTDEAGTTVISSGSEKVKNKVFGFSIGYSF